jgi:hypothetical protein
MTEDRDQGNIDYRVYRLEKEVDETVKVLHDDVKRIDTSISDIEKELIEQKMKVSSTEKKISNFETIVNWVVKLVVGAVIMALLAMVLKSK